MRKIWAVLTKELKRLFTDKRMLLSMVLPGIIIFIVYSLMGNLLKDQFTAEKNHEYIVYTYHQPEQFLSLNDTEEYKIVLHENEKEYQEAKDLLIEKEIDLVIIFDEDFSQKLQEEKSPSVAIYYNSTSPESTEIYQYYYSHILESAVEVQYHFLVNMGSESYDLATKEDTSIQIITMLVPLLLVMLLFSGCMSICIESIAGEKERGTIATIFVTPTKRSSIAIGKIMALAIASLLSSVSSFIGLIASFPKLMQMQGENGITLDMYGIDTYLTIFVLMIVLVFLFTTLLSLISTFAKSVKEASQYAAPIMIIVMVFGLASLFGSKGTPNIALYLIPIYNSVLCVSETLSLSFSLTHFLISVLSNLLYISLGIYLLTKMFASEKIIFNK